MKKEFAKKKETRGGLRPGSGRPKGSVKATAKRTITMRVTPDEKALIEQHRTP